jgi:uncharacterized protein YjbJ (UPF0337 family)
LLKNSCGISITILAGGEIMSGKTDIIKGRIKEAAGALTGNDKLRDEGKADQVVGKVKELVHDVVENVTDAVKKVAKK